MQKTARLEFRISQTKKVAFTKFAKSKKKKQTAIVESYIDRCLAAKKIL